MGDISNPPGDGDFTFEETQALEYDDVFRARTGSAVGGVTVRFSGYDRHQQRQGSFEMPTAAISASALELIGFNQSTAESIYERFINRPDPSINIDSFLDYATSQAQRIWVLKSRDYTDCEAMTRVGLTIDFQDRMLDPRFKAVYETETLLFWVLDTLKVGYTALEQLHERLKHRVKVIKATIAISQTPEGHSLPANFIPAETEPALPSPLKYVALYKATSALEMGGTPWIDDDGGVDMNVISSFPGGDSNYCSMVHYWTPEREVAELYRKWAQRRCPYSETWIVRICVPIALINSIPTAELWYSPDWKEFVWYCRREKTPPEKFSRLDPENRAIGLIEGHISTNIAQQVAHIKKEDVQSMINDDSALRNPITGSMATQWVFTIPSTIDRLGIEIRGRIHIDVTAVPKSGGKE
ncbi:hypothetical protein VE01_10029 [Pseudogymnoascus verrucosus]|uniref:Uncharacterized protein n=1 Tax=Pseudogymnoascus verrucosus TaxID=342668 RepID=A0A1B8G8P6_9PEZI|nr:uncharacterized protein VE01_10029 [Pseudogymnoascus verrucosus]OBT92187.1 hypothetical protein VE01_10029 [Pseudogymnoascus verrucosus]